MQQAEFTIEKKRIAQSFSQAARTYDSHAALQRKVADTLLAKLSSNPSVQRVLDLGSGTGYCTKALHACYPNAEIISLDIAEAMLLFAANRHQTDGFKEKAICADAEALPFIDNSFDVVFSNLSIQWCQNYSVLFSELNRILMPRAIFYISTFGPDTLQELSRAWQQVDSYVHVNHFQPALFLKHQIDKQNFHALQIEPESICMYYQNFEMLARELKSLGANNKNSGQGKGLNGRKKILKLKQAFELNADQKGIPVTYQIYYLQAQGL